MQHFKTVYFSDLAGATGSRKSLTLAFGSQDVEIFDAIEKLSSVRVRDMLGDDSFQVLENRAKQSGKSLNTFCRDKIRETIGSGYFEQREKFSDKLQVTFSGGRHDPMHDWFPYLEGYSPDFVWEILQNYAPNAEIILDPFGGSGTTPITSMSLGKLGLYSDVNPLCRMIIEAKSIASQLPSQERGNLVASLQVLANEIKRDGLNSSADAEIKESYKACFGNSVFFSPENFELVLKARTFVDEIQSEQTRLFVEIAAVRSLIPASLLIRRGDLRFKNEKELSKGTAKLIDVFCDSIALIADDISSMRPSSGSVQCIGESALATNYIHKIDAVVTSPPYLNGTNYFRNTKVELWFTRQLKDKAGLRAFRHEAVTAGINDVTKGKSQLRDEVYQSLRLDEIVKVVTESAYDVRIPMMVRGYFNDLFATFERIVPQLNKDGVVAVDIGDSSYAGVHVPTDDLLIELMEQLGLRKIDEVVLRERMSRSGFKLSQKLLVFDKPSSTKKNRRLPTKWSAFKKNLPHQTGEMAARNWGNQLHSLCSYQGKLKPAIANLLVDSLVPNNGTVLDPFSGVGTIPFEAALSGRMSFGFDISPSAFHISNAKVTRQKRDEVKPLLEQLSEYIAKYQLRESDLDEAKRISFNSSVVDYFHPDTMAEILAARSFFLQPRTDPAFSLLQACMQHILHGNRPYALSRRSHPITPYAPSGDFEYRGLMERLTAKVERSLSHDLGSSFVDGQIWNIDCTSRWPDEVNELDAVITSPPFFDSTRFYLANWMRLWFSGWDRSSFDIRPQEFIDERQKKGFNVYDAIFRSSAERMKKGAYFALHLGKSKKCDMAEEIQKISKPYFRIADVFTESVEHCESHGFRDKGTVTGHQYLVLER